MLDKKHTVVANKRLVEILTSVRKESGVSLTKLGELVGISETTVRQAVATTRMDKTKPATLLGFILLVAESVTFKSHGPFETTVASDHVYTAEEDAAEAWLLSLGHEILEAKKMTHADARKNYGFDSTHTQAIFNRTGHSRFSLFATMLLISALGYRFSIEVKSKAGEIYTLTVDVGEVNRRNFVRGPFTDNDHEECRSDPLGRTPRVPRLKKNRATFIELADKADISRMMRGQVKTSLGETVRAFL